MAASLLDLLTGSALRHPERAAVSLVGEPALTYRELALRSTRLARYLHARGVRRGDRVGLLVPKSVESVVGLWGAMMAGAAYVPIDPAAPPARAALIAADCGVKAVLVSGELQAAAAAVFAAVPGAALVQTHGEDAVPGASPVEESARGSLPSPNVKDLAYVLYTSGSTGTPKGVMVTHSAALSFVEWAVARFGVTSTDTLSNHAPFHFDLSTFDVFGAACAGARVVVLDAETVLFPAASAAALERERVTVWYSVPGALRQMLRHGGLADRDTGSLRVVLFAGEAYPADELRALQRALPGRAFFNLYGPTETNVCTYWRVPPPDEWSDPAPLLGVDCENCEGVVVDPDGRPVPDGTPGELLVRGGTVMAGYWGDPERTRRVLVADFLHPHLEDRLCRTGDIVTRRDDGQYILHGRGDHMVKVRGYRVELGEVEAALHRAPSVVDAAVVAVERQGQDGPVNELVAFVVVDGASEDAARLEAMLRRQLGSELPRYMIPAEFVKTRRMPVTTSGKVDRQALIELARRPKGSREE